MRSNQSILKEINPEYSLRGLMLKLKLQYFGHLMWRANSLEKTLMMGKIEGRRRRGRQRMRWLDGITNSMDLSLEWTPGVGDGQGGLACCNSWGRKDLDTTEWLNWTELICSYAFRSYDDHLCDEATRGKGCHRAFWNVPFYDLGSGYLGMFTLWTFVEMCPNDVCTFWMYACET